MRNLKRMIAKNPLIWVLGMFLVGGLFFNRFMNKTGLSKYMPAMLKDQIATDEMEVE